MKRILIALLSLSMLASLAACGKAPAEKPAKEPGEGATPGKKYEITLSSHQTTSSPHNWVIEEFKARVEEATDGNVIVNNFPGGQLGNARENIEGVQAGTIQMCLADTGTIALWTNEYNILQLPFLFRDYDHLNKVLASDIVKDNMDARLIANRGIHPLGWYPDGLRNFLLKKPVSDLNGFKGMKIRAMESDVVIDTINGLGAAATPIPWNEVYTSLQTNVVEGMEAAPTSIYAMKFQEVATNLVMTEHINLGVTLLINEKFFQDLPEEYQTILLDVMAEVAEEQKAATVAQMEEAVQNLQKAGCTVIEVDKAALADALQPVWDKYSSTIEGGQEMIDQILAVE